MLQEMSPRENSAVGQVAESQLCAQQCTSLLPGPPSSTAFGDGAERTAKQECKALGERKPFTTGSSNLRAGTCNSSFPGWLANSIKS